MTLIQAKQIERLVSAPVLVTSHTVATAGTTADVDAAIIAALAGAGNNGTAVANQISTDLDTEGVIVSGIFSRSEIYDATTQDKLQHSSGAEVYGRIAESGGAYQLNFYYLDAGTETAFTLPAQDIDFSFNYRYSFGDFPNEGLIGMRALRSAQDPAGTSQYNTAQLLTVTAPNTLDALLSNPVAPGMKLFVNGYVAHTDSGDFTVSGTTINWQPANAGYDLETTDTVVAEYAVV